MEEDVLTIEHLKALRDLPFMLRPVFDIELYKANNPRWREQFIVVQDEQGDSRNEDIGEIQPE